MGQTWRGLLFAHWPVDPQELRPKVHPSIPIDTFDGQAWIAVTPFTVSGLHFRITPPLPLISRFHEINVRTYATIDGKPGIYFFSLDAHSRPAVYAARKTYRLPYFHSHITRDGRRYRSKRTHGPPATFDADYEPTGPPATATPGGFEHWCAERYCVYTTDARHRVLRGDIHHPPWPLQKATARIRENTMAEHVGIALDGDPVLHYGARQEVVFWPLRHG